ncbi:DUF7310 family coiled-coil domain-containing protein [Halobaculum rarum]|uniref:DUF7310 family coiled-coil domain-containing protein n=1 Tax=Halobaculum rarum TaxID=3075122 RepID=UPI0032AED6AE
MSRDTSDRLSPEDGRQTDTDTDSAGTTATVEDLRSRIAAVERACTDGTDADLTDLADAAEATAELQRASTRLDDLEARVAELESATQALRGYVGSIRAVNERVERRADRALAATREEPAEERPDQTCSEQTRPAAGRPAIDGTANPADVVGDVTSDSTDGAGEPDDDGPLVERLRDAL